MPYKNPETARDCHRKTQRRWYEKKAEYDPTYHRNWWLVRNYGITTAEWDALFERQGRSCAVCRSPNPGSKKGWHTDHDQVCIGQLGDSYAEIAARTARILEYVQ